MGIRTGFGPRTWVVSAGLDDFSALFEAQPCGLPTLDFDSLLMDVPGGSVHRPAVKVDRPTFGPARSCACVGAQEQTAPLILGRPAAVGLAEPGQLEWFVGRNARRTGSGPFSGAFVRFNASFDRARLANPLRGSNVLRESEGRAGKALRWS